MSKDCQSHGKKARKHAGKDCSKAVASGSQLLKVLSYWGEEAHAGATLESWPAQIRRGPEAASRGFPRWDFHQPARGSSTYTETHPMVKLHVQKLVCLFGNKEDRCCIVSHLSTSWSTLNYSQLRTSARKGRRERGGRGSERGRGNEYHKTLLVPKAPDV